MNFTRDIKIKLLIEQGSGGQVYQLIPLDENIKEENESVIQAFTGSCCPSCRTQLNIEVNLVQHQMDTYNPPAFNVSGSYIDDAGIFSGVSVASSSGTAIQGPQLDEQQYLKRFEVLSKRVGRTDVRDDFIFKNKDTLHTYLLRNDYFYTCLRKRALEGKELQPHESGKLCKMILRAILNYSPLAVPHGEWKLLSQHITDLFPLEKKEIYYHNTTKDIGGRLYGSWRALKGDLQSYGLLVLGAHLKKKIKLDDKNNPSAKDPIDDALEKMKTIVEPFDEVIRLWRQTYPQRINGILHNSKLLCRYTEMFEFLKRQEGIGLLVDDTNRYFSTEHKPPLRDGIADFKTTTARILTALMNDKLVDDTIKQVASTALGSQDKDFIDLTALCNFAHLFSPSARSTVGFNTVRKPNRNQVQQFFVANYPSEAAAREFLNNIAKMVEEKKNTERLHPIGVIVGDLSNKSSLVFILQILDLEYRIQEIWQGVDLYFKLFLMMKCDFPAAAIAVWSFFAEHFFGVEPPAEVSHKATYHNMRQSISARIRP